MADETKAVVGLTEPGEVRRIGARHAVVLAPREARVVDMGATQRGVEQIDRRLERIALERRQLEAQRAELALTLRQFQDLPIERRRGDPDVPQVNPPGRVETETVVVEAVPVASLSVDEAAPTEKA